MITTIIIYLATFTAGAVFIGIIANMNIKALQKTINVITQTYEARTNQMVAEYSLLVKNSKEIEDLLNSEMSYSKNLKKKIQSLQTKGNYYKKRINKLEKELETIRPSVKAGRKFNNNHK